MVLAKNNNNMSDEEIVIEMAPIKNTKTSKTLAITLILSFTLIILLGYAFYWMINIYIPKVVKNVEISSNEIIRNLNQNNKSNESRLILLSQDLKEISKIIKTSDIIKIDKKINLIKLISENNSKKLLFFFY